MRLSLDPAMVRRRWRWPVLGLVIGLLGGMASTFFVVDVSDVNRYYRATHTLAVRARDAGGTSQGGSLDLAQVAYLVHSSRVTSVIGKELAIPVEGVDQRVSAVARPDLDALEVTSIGLSPEEAELVADAAARTLADVSAQDEKQRYATQTDLAQKRLDRIQGQLDEVRTKVAARPEDLLAGAEMSSLVDRRAVAYEEFRTLSALGGPTAALMTIQKATAVEINARGFRGRLNQNMDAARANVVTRAATTTTTMSPQAEMDLIRVVPASNPSRVLVGGLVGLLLGAAVGLIIEVWDDRVRRRQVVESLTGMTVLVEVPKRVRDQLTTGRVVAVDLPDSLSAERYRSLRTSVMFALHDHLDTGSGEMWVDGQAPVVMVTSPHPGEGKTTSIANLAAVFGASGMRTLVIDGDYRRPSIASYVRPEPESDEADQPMKTRLSGVRFLPAPEGESPAEIIVRLGDAVARWRGSFDMVLLDTPPMMATNDAAELLPVVDGVLLVLRSGRTRKVSTERTVSILRRFDAPAIGVVLNGCEGVAPLQYGAYLREDKRGRAARASARSTARRFGDDPAQPADDEILSGSTPRPNG